MDDDEDLDTPKEVHITTDEDESTTEDDVTSGGTDYTRRGSRDVGVGGSERVMMMEESSSVFLDVPRTQGSSGGGVGSVGSPGVPGRPILHTGR